MRMLSFIGLGFINLAYRFGSFNWKLNIILILVIYDRGRLALCCFRIKKIKILRPNLASITANVRKSIQIKEILVKNLIC